MLCRRARIDLIVRDRINGDSVTENHSQIVIVISFRAADRPPVL